ncbi:M23 family metallopeptidase [Sphingomonas adhaesiva]|uniref:M23 family metallopeptidase n=1 Tax=Sphingomonas adhaesiva TaxID=28212 RepID=UPI002FFD082D
MTRLGWSILALILLAVAGFASLLSFDGAERTRRAVAAREEAPPVDAAPAPAPGELVVPVAGYPRAALRDHWGDPRDGGARAHTGIDLMAPAGTPVVAAAPGRVEKLFLSNAGGTTLYQRSPDRRLAFYYAHLAGYAPGIAEGQRVRAGQTLGYVGDSGNAGAGNYHLHFGISRMAQDDRWWQGQAVDPYPLLARGARSR